MHLYLSSFTYLIWRTHGLGSFRLLGIRKVFSIDYKLWYDLSFYECSWLLNLNIEVAVIVSGGLRSLLKSPKLCEGESLSPSSSLILSFLLLLCELPKYYSYFLTKNHHNYYCRRQYANRPIQLYPSHITRTLELRHCLESGPPDKKFRCSFFDIGDLKHSSMVASAPTYSSISIRTRIYVRETSPMSSAIGRLSLQVPGAYSILQKVGPFWGIQFVREHNHYSSK